MCAMYGLSISMHEVDMTSLGPHYDVMCMTIAFFLHNEYPNVILKMYFSNKTVIDVFVLCV